MTAVALIPAQCARARELGHLLAAAERCDLWLEADGSSVLTHAEYFGLSEPIDTVTEEVELAKSAGFLVSHPLSLGGPGGSWGLTLAGDAALAFYRADLQRRTSR